MLQTYQGKASRHGYYADIEILTSKFDLQVSGLNLYMASSL
jgi:hypothetical protein